MNLGFLGLDQGKDSQGNYDYLESIYQWEATCGSDANDTEAFYHPYDDDYDAGYVGTFVEEYLKKTGNPENRAGRNGL